MATTTTARRTAAAGDEEDGLGQLAAGIMAAPEDGAQDPQAPVAPVAAPGLSEGPDGLTLRRVLATWGASPLLVLTALNAVDELDRIAFIILGPDIQRTFGLSDAALGGVNGISGLLVVAMAIPFAVAADRRRRTTLAGAAGLVWAVFAFLTGVVRSTGQLVVVRILSGLGKASVDPVHGSLLSDYYPVAARGRVFAAHAAANPLAGVIGPVLAGTIAYVAGGDEGWRWAFVLATPLSIVAALAAFRLREPKRGGQERGDATPDDVAEPAPAGDSDPKALRIPLGTGFRRLLQIRSLRFLYLGIGVLGVGIVTGPLLLSLHFEEALSVNELGRGVIFTLLAGGGLLFIGPGGVAADRLFRHDPSWPLFLIGALIVAYTVVTALALFLPGVVAPVIALVLAQGLVAATPAAVRQMVAATAPPPLRSLSFAMLGIYILLFGGFIGGVALGAISDASSPRTALTVLILPALLAGALIVVGSRYVSGDIAMVVEDLREEERAAARRRTDASNLLEIRNLDFSYGPVQVLFDVSLDVREGEVVALLGTNGAGKSTLLRAITGLDHPTRGSIRFRGEDTTYIETEQLLALGVAQMPGGRAVFPGLTVGENLLVGAYSFRGDKARVADEVARVEGWFPILAERRDQLASTLSGGEQQMLALGKAFLTRPALVCIDELSLGLAPTVVASLLELVRGLHVTGTTVIIVEQSVNVALSLATTAVFMEKGQVRFQGPAQELLDRPDLLRSVFLEGAARAQPGR